ncbi:uncharacterized protein [Diadema setosum]|uniref:uncharacterized protein n=1 Tax=Diadema setosum TaxID=31175 RepID=UPI003B3BAE1F
MRVTVLFLLVFLAVISPALCQRQWRNQRVQQRRQNGQRPAKQVQQMESEEEEDVQEVAQALTRQQRKYAQQMRRPYYMQNMRAEQEEAESEGSESEASESEFESSEGGEGEGEPAGQQAGEESESEAPESESEGSESEGEEWESSEGEGAEAAEAGEEAEGNEGAEAGEGAGGAGGIGGYGDANAGGAGNTGGFGAFSGSSFVGPSLSSIGGSLGMGSSAGSADSFNSEVPSGGSAVSAGAGGSNYGGIQRPTGGSQNATVGSQGSAGGSQGATVGSQGASGGSQGATVGSQGASGGSQGATVGSQGASGGSQGATVDSQGATVGSQGAAGGSQSVGGGEQAQTNGSQVGTGISQGSESSGFNGFGPSFGSYDNTNNGPQGEHTIDYAPAPLGQGGNESTAAEPDTTAVDREYLDQHLCGGFLGANGINGLKDLAVLAFDFAGKRQALNPCNVPSNGRTTRRRPVNIAFRSAMESRGQDPAGAVLRDVPGMIQRYERTPLKVHLFSWYTPSEHALRSLLNKKQRGGLASSDIVVGYVEESKMARLSALLGDTSYTDLLMALEQAGISVQRICGSCQQVANMTKWQRKRKGLINGVEVFDQQNGQCGPVPEVQAAKRLALGSPQCQSFQDSMASCLYDKLTSVCPWLRNAEATGPHPLSSLMETWAAECGKSESCWRGKGGPLSYLARAVASCRVYPGRAAAGINQCVASSMDVPLDPPQIQPTL